MASYDRDARRVVSRSLARAAALGHAGRYAEVVGVASEALDQAMRVGDRGLEARARARLGTALRRAGHVEAPARELESAAFMAQAAGDDETAARAMAPLVLVVGVDLARVEAGLWWGRHAEAALERSGGDPLTEAERLDNLGLVHYGLGDFDLAETYHRRALEVAEQGLPSDHSAIATYVQNLGNVAFARGSPS